VKIKTEYSPRWVLLLTFLLTATLLISACNTTPVEKVDETSNDQQSEVYLPSTGSEAETKPEVKDEPEDVVAYPDSEQEKQNPEVADASQAEAYPEPKEEATATQELTSTPKVEPTQEPQPTSRGNELHAADPNTVNLASGKLQLVEMFAFW